MPALLDPTRALQVPERRLDAFQALLPQLGWPSTDRLPGADHRGLEVSSGGEPQLLVIPNRSALLATRLSYSREVPYVLNVDQDRLELHRARRWRELPGDAPLVGANIDDLDELARVLDLLRRDRVLADAPLELRQARGADHEPLAAVLGGALARLRAEVAETDAYEGSAPRDSAVLRLFHQILYVRVVEDRAAEQLVGIRALLDHDEPGGALTELLGEYESTLDSELFLATGIDASCLPADALRSVLRATVEPWKALELDFSVARTEIASRLYESYLKQRPVRRTAKEGGTLFPVTQVVDQRSQQATFYTPPALAHRLASAALAHVATDRPRILDPACGSGAFLIAAYRCLLETEERRLGRPLRSADREALILDCLFGVDVDEEALGIARVQLLDEARLSGGKLPSLAANLINGEALATPPGSEPRVGAVHWDHVLERVGTFDCILANPPFGAQAKLPQRLPTASVTEVRATYPEVRAFGNDYAYAFVALARRLAGKQTTAAFVLPRTVLSQKAGLGTRQLMAVWGAAQIDDFRGVRLFPGTSAAVCSVVLSARSEECKVSSIRDSRTAPGEALDALDAEDPNTSVTLRCTTARMVEAVPEGWTPFRLRWHELRKDLQASMSTFASDARRVVRTGVKTGDVGRFVLGSDDWTADDAFVEAGGRRVHGRYLPEVVRSANLRPFLVRPSGERVLLPFESSGAPASPPEVQALVCARGGLPTNYQHGDLEVLRGPKVLLSSVAREPAAFADVNGRFVPMMRGVHALSLGDMSAESLPAIAALLQSSFYQWLLRGLGAPRSDESVEISTGLVQLLPWPDLDDAALARLCALASAVRDTFSVERPIDRIHAFAAAREELDEAVFTLLGASERLRTIVRSERLRVA